LPTGISQNFEAKASCISRYFSITQSSPPLPTGRFFRTGATEIAARAGPWCGIRENGRSGQRFNWLAENNSGLLLGSLRGLVDMFFGSAVGLQRRSRRNASPEIPHRRSRWLAPADYQNLPRPDCRSADRGVEADGSEARKLLFPVPCRSVRRCLPPGRVGALKLGLNAISPTVIHRRCPRPVTQFDAPARQKLSDRSSEVDQTFGGKVFLAPKARLSSSVQPQFAFALVVAPKPANLPALCG